jgi:5-methylcytosine-specific restriction endonuclease McrA
MRRKRLSREDYQRLRIKILQRDRWKCQRCGAAHQLDVHHILLRSRGGDDEIMNLITLCRSCHRETHSV